MHHFAELAMLRQLITLRKLLRAIFSQPHLCNSRHDQACYELARGIGHEAIREHRELSPGEPVRY